MGSYDTSEPQFDPAAAPEQLPPGQRESASTTTTTPFAVNPEAKAAQTARTNAAIDTARAAPGQWAGELAKGEAESDGIAKRYQAKSQQVQGDEQAQNEAAFGPLKAEAAKHAAAYDKALAQRQEYRATALQHIEDMDKYSKLIAAEQPHDIWAESSTPLKIAGIVAMGLGAGIQAIYGDRTNVVSDQIENAIKKDLLMQRMRMEKNQQNYANKNLLIGKFMDANEHLQTAEDKAYVTAMDGVIGRMKVNASLLTDPKMRMQMMNTATELEMKSAGVRQRNTEFMAGQDIRMSEQLAQLEQKRDSSGNELGMMKAQTAASNAGIKRESLDLRKGQEAEKRGMVGWSGQFLGRDEDASKFREKDATIQNTVRVLDTLAEQTKKGLGNFTSFKEFDKLRQAYNQAVFHLKGPALANTGANFTELENKLIGAGFLAKDRKTILDPKGAAELIQDAEQSILEDLQVEGKTHGVAPSKHPLLGGD